ncbi:class I adenylate-forming enzyme family protein [Sphingomonas sp. BK481]|uniref:AMP-binding protein n=1 Tax=Sphingomonas sp. BK481 TaxID=2586981 RepID=UPI001620D99C|nr:class I adenylate-forming enzyme family protein [Sphingomonas sp. BK481]MBB3586365.1 4-coumarate--CoA ligase [Sphingomonas sp. BK481]
MYRIACAVTAIEVQRLRDGSLFSMLSGEWPEDMLIGDEGLGLDSLEQLGALGALAETFGLDDTSLAAQAPQKVSDWIDWTMAGYEAGGCTITVKTSGSTGAARPCVHALGTLLNEAAYLANRFADRKRVIAMVPANHLYGMIWTAFLPSALGVPVVVRPLGTTLELVAGDLVVAVPDQWQAISRMTRRFPNDVVGVSSAGVLDDLVAKELLSAGLSRLIDVYGSSETGAIALRQVPDAMYELLPRWNLVPRSDHDWDLSDGGGSLTEMPDLIERAGERWLRPVGRRDGAVKVAGLNVWPNHVAEVLRRADGVADVTVRLHANGRLKAFVVPEAGLEASDLAFHLDRFAVQNLKDHERPKSFRFGTVLPRNAMGKLEDWA